MRILVFFDLPTNNKKERKEASRFRNFLITDGYDMLQFSVYGLTTVNGKYCTAGI